MRKRVPRRGGAAGGHRAAAAVAVATQGAQAAGGAARHRRFGWPAVCCTSSRKEDPAHHERPQLNVATQDARWFLLCKVDGVTVTTADGRGVVYRQRDRAKMFELLRAVDAPAAPAAARKFDEMRRVYREALPVLSSKQKWETVSAGSRDPACERWPEPRRRGPPRGEDAALVAVQSALADRPGVLARCARRCPTSVSTARLAGRRRRSARCCSRAGDAAWLAAGVGRVRRARGRGA